MTEALNLTCKYSFLLSWKEFACLSSNYGREDLRNVITVEIMLEPEERNVERNEDR